MLLKGEETGREGLGVFRRLGKEESERGRSSGGVERWNEMTEERMEGGR